LQKKNPIITFPTLYRFCAHTNKKLCLFRQKREKRRTRRIRIRKLK